VRDIWILATSSSAAGIIIIIDIILQEHEHSVVYTLSARAMRFLRPRSSIPHLCVLETDNEGGQIPGIAVSQHPSISRSPFIKSPPHNNQTVPQAADLSPTSALLNAIIMEWQ
jgi:hypothetical protein